MSKSDGAIHEAIGRWESERLIDAALATRLRDEVSGHAEVTSRRLSQYVLAATGAVLLLMAGGVFLNWAWPHMGVEGQSGVLAILAVAALVGGAQLESEYRWRPAAYLLQTAGLGLLLGAFAHTEDVWADQSPGGIMVGVLALVAPIVLTARSMKRNVFMPAVHLAFGLVFLAMFLDRATPLSADDIVWVLDAVLIGAVLALVNLLRNDPELEERPWALNAFVMAMGVGFFMVGLTAAGPLRWTNEVYFALDLWLFVSVALTLWGIHRAPAGLRRDWFQHLLSWEMFAWTFLGCLTVSEGLNGTPLGAVLIVGGAGVFGFLHADHFGFEGLMAASSLAFIVPVWWWAVDAAGALGAIFALVATAALLFWASGRRDRMRDGTDDGPRPEPPLPSSGSRT